MRKRAVGLASLRGMGCAGVEVLGRDFAWLMLDSLAFGATSLRSCATPSLFARLCTDRARPSPFLRDFAPPVRDPLPFCSTSLRPCATFPHSARLCSVRARPPPFLLDFEPNLRDHLLSSTQKRPLRFLSVVFNQPYFVSNSASFAFGRTTTKYVWIIIKMFPITQYRERADGKVTPAMMIITGIT